MFKKKNKDKWPETKCVVILPDGGLVEVNQAVYNYIRELEHDLAREKMMKNIPDPEEPLILYECDRKDGWIKFKDRKPDKDGEYLCLTVISPGETGFDEYTIDIITYYTDRNSFGWYDFGDEPTFYREIVHY